MQALCLLPLVVNDHVGHVPQALTLQLLAQAVHSGSLHQAEQSAGLEKCHYCHLAHPFLHRFHLPYLPGRRRLTARPTSITLCSAPMEQAESEEQAEASPHHCGASSLPQVVWLKSFLPSAQFFAAATPGTKTSLCPRCSPLLYSACCFAIRKEDKVQSQL